MKNIDPGMAKMNIASEKTEVDRSSWVADRPFSYLSRANRVRGPVVAIIMMFVMLLAMTITEGTMPYRVCIVLYLLICAWILKTCLFNSISQSVIWVIVIVAYEPLVKELLTDLGGQFTKYIITFSLCILSVRARRLSLISILMGIVAIVFTYHALSNLFGGLNISELADQNYRALINQPVFYWGGCFTAIVFDNWKPDGKDFKDFVIVTSLSFISTILLSGIWKYYLDGFDIYNMLVGWRFDFVGNTGANSMGVLLICTTVFMCLYWVEKLTFTYYLTLGIGLVLVILTRSRYQIFFISVFLPIMHILIYPKRIRNLYFLLSIALLGYLVFSIQSQDWLYSLLRLGPENGEMSYRIDVLWRLYLDAFIENPIFGVDMIQYEKIFSLTAHNPYLALLTQTGLIGGLSFMVVTILIFYRIIYSWNSNDRMHRMLSLLSVATILGAMSIDIWNYYYFIFLFISLIQVRYIDETEISARTFELRKV